MYGVDSRALLRCKLIYVLVISQAVVLAALDPKLTNRQTVVMLYVRYSHCPPASLSHSLSLHSLSCPPLQSIRLFLLLLHFPSLLWATICFLKLSHVVHMILSPSVPSIKPFVHRQMAFLVPCRMP